MNRIIFPLEAGKQGPEVVNLQVALQLLLGRGVIRQDEEGARRELSTELDALNPKPALPGRQVARAGGKGVKSLDTRFSQAAPLGVERPRICKQP